MHEPPPVLGDLRKIWGDAASAATPCPLGGRHGRYCFEARRGLLRRIADMRKPRDFPSGAWVARYWLTRGRGLEPLALQPLGEEIDEHLCLGRWRPRRGPHLLQWRRRCLEAREDELDPALIEQGADLPQRRLRDTEAGRRVHSGCGGDRPHRTARRM